MSGFSQTEKDKFYIDKVIEDVIDKGKSLETAEKEVELKFNHKLGGIDRTYIEDKYIDQLTKCWLQEASELFINHFHDLCVTVDKSSVYEESISKEKNINKFLDDLNLINSFEDCLNSSIFNKSKFNILVFKLHKDSRTLKTKENDIISKLKQRSLVCAQNLILECNAEIDFLECFKEFFMSSKTIKEDLETLKTKLFINDKINFESFLLNLQQCHLPLGQKLKRAGKKLSNQKIFALRGEFEKIVSDYTNLVITLNKSFTDGRSVIEIKGQHIIVSNCLHKIEQSPSFHLVEEVRFISPSGAIHIDANLSKNLWHGKNIVVFSKAVIINGDKEIVWDVSGRDAEIICQDKAETANNGWGELGAKGIVGESGGNVFMKFSCIENSDKLKIISHGGRGSKGQDGGIGLRGKDGAYLEQNNFISKFPPVSKLNDDKKREHLIKTFNSVFSNLQHVQRCKIGCIELGQISNKEFQEVAISSTVADLKNLYFEVRTIDGCRITFSFYFDGFPSVCQSFLLYEGADGEEGKPGGLGGLGGQGGFAGEIEIQSTQCSKITWHAVNGKKGDDGKSGEQGPPGKSGCDIAYVDRTMYMPMRKQGWPKVYQSPSNEKVKLTLAKSDSNEYYSVWCPLEDDYVKVTQIKRIEKRHHDSASLQFRPLDHRQELQVTRKKTIDVNAIVDQYKEDTSIVDFGTVQERFAEALDKLEDALETIVKVEKQTSTNIKVVKEVSDFFSYQTLLDEETVTIETSEDELCEEIFQNNEEVIHTNNKVKSQPNPFTEKFKQKVKDLEKFLIGNELNHNLLESNTRALKEDKSNSYQNDVILFFCGNLEDNLSGILEILKTLPIKDSKLLRALKIFTTEFCSTDNISLYGEETFHAMQHTRMLFEEREKNMDHLLGEKFTPFKKVLLHRGNEKLFNLFLKAFVEKDCKLKIQFEKELSLDRFLYALYVGFNKQANKKNISLFEGENLSEALSKSNEALHKCFEQRGVFAACNRELLALYYDTNILLYKKNEKNELILTDNHNPNGTNKAYFLIKENKFVNLTIDNGLASMIEKQSTNGRTYNKILLQLESMNYVFPDNFDNPNIFYEDFVNEKTLLAKTKLFLDRKSEDNNISFIVKSFQKENDKSMKLEAKLEKLKSDVLGRPNLLHFISLKFKCEGRKVKANEFDFILTLILKLALQEPQVMDTIAWIFVTEDQSSWLFELALIRLEVYFKYTLSSELTIKWKENLSDSSHLKDSHKDSLMFLLASLDDENLKVSEDCVSEIFYLFKNISNAHDGLNGLHISEWKYYLKDRYWESKMINIANWSKDQLKSLSYYLTVMENLKGSTLSESVVALLENKASELDSDISKKVGVDIIKDLASTEIILNKKMLSMLSKHEIQKWENLIKGKPLKSNEDRSLENLIELMKFSGNTSKNIINDLDKIKKSLDTLNMISDLLKSDTNATGTKNSTKKILEYLNEFAKVESPSIAGNFYCNLSPPIFNENPKAFIKFLAQSKELSPVVLLPFVTKVIEITHNIVLRNTQKLAILVVLHNNGNTLAQISTGEGKSLIVVALAAIKALQKESKEEEGRSKKVHIVTSSRVLAIRDANAYKDIFEFCGIKVGHNCSEDIEERKKVYSSCQVIYGDLGNFQRDYLLDRFYNKNILGDSDFESAIVDEVDSMLLDRSNNVLYLSHDIPEFDKLEPVFIFIWTWLNRPANSKEELELCFDIENLKNKILFEAFGFITKQNIKDLDTTLTVKQIHDTWELLVKENIIDVKGKVIKNTLTDCQQIFDSISNNYIPNEYLVGLLRKVFERERHLVIPNHLKSFVELHLDEWIKSGVKALTMEVGRDYVVDVDRSGTDCDRNPKIIIIDRDTGNDLFNSEWDGALHQFLQLKHGCKLSLISLKAVFVSNTHFFKLYKTLCGLTGTLGSNRERDLLKSSHNVDFVTIPTAKPKSLSEELPILCSNKDDWSAKIEESVCKITKKRSVLVICESVNDVNFLKAKLSQFKKVHTYTRDYESFSEVHTYTRDYESFSAADNLEPGEIIIATNLAGRGTDIKLSKSLISNGGLHVCLTFLPSNCRVEEQAYGRVARNGQPGTCQLIFISNCSLNRNALKVIDIKKQRDINEVKRLSEIKKFFDTQILLEEKFLEEFKCIYKNLKDNTTQKLEINQILLKVALDKWALWLDSNSKLFSSGSSSLLDLSFERFRSDCSILCSDEFCEWSKQISNPSHLIQLGLHLTEIDRNQAMLLFERVINEEEHFSEFARYYKIFVSATIKDLTKEEVCDDLKAIASQFKERINSSFRAANLIDNFKELCPQNIIQIDSFKNQQENVSKIYGVFLESLYDILGYEVTPKTFTISNFVDKEMAHRIFSSLTAKNVIEKPFIKSSPSKEALKFVETFGILPDIFGEFLNQFEGEEFNELIFVKALKKANIIPCKELFWKELLKNNVLFDEEIYIFINLQKLKAIDPTLAMKFQNISFENVENLENSVWLYEDEYVIEESSLQVVLKKQNLTDMIGKERYTFLKRKGVLIVNKQAKFLKPQGFVAFDYFDSIGPKHIDYLKMPPLVCDEIFCNLLKSNLIQQKNQEEFIAHEDHVNQIKTIEVERFKAYTEALRSLFSVCFAFRIALKECILLIENGEKLFIPLPPSPHDKIVSELSNRGLIEKSVVNPKINLDQVEESLKLKKISDYINLFEEIFDLDQSVDIVNHLIEQNWLISSDPPSQHIKTYSINNAPMKDLSFNQNKTDLISFVLSNQKRYFEYVSMHWKNIKEILEKSKGHTSKEKMEITLRPVLDILKEKKMPLSEEALFSLNGYNQVFNLKGKSTWKIVCKALLLAFPSMWKIAIGLYMMYRRNPSGVSVFMSGAYELLNCLSCLFPSVFGKWKSYFDNIHTFFATFRSSINLSTSSFGRNLFSWKSAKEFGRGLLENLARVVETKKVDGSFSVKSMIRNVTIEVSTIEEGLNCVDNIVDFQLGKLEENLFKLVFSEFYDFIDNNVSISQYVKELSGRICEKDIKKFVAKLFNKLLKENKANIEKEFNKSSYDFDSIISQVVNDYFKNEIDGSLECEEKRNPNLSNNVTDIINLIQEKLSQHFKQLPTLSSVISDFEASLNEICERYKQKPKKYESVDSEKSTLVLKEMVKNMLHYQLKENITDPVLHHTGNLLLKYSSSAVLEPKQISKYLSKADCTDSKNERKQYLQTKIKSTNTKTRNIDIKEEEYNKCLVKIFKLKRSAKIFAEMLKRNVSVETDVFKESCLLTLRTLRKENFSNILALDLVDESKGTYERISCSTNIQNIKESEIPTVLIPFKSKCALNRENNALFQISEVFEAIYYGISQSRPEIISIGCSAKLLDLVTDKVDGEEFSSTNDLIKPKNNLNELVEKKHPSQHSGFNVHWTFNPESDNDLRQEEKIPLSMVEEHIMEGFNVALAQINYHLTKYMNCGFKLDLEDFVKTRYEITPQTNEALRNNFKFYPGEYKAIVPLPVSKSEPENFTISMSLKTEISEKELNCPLCPHIVYEVNHLDFLIHIKYGIKGYILLNNVVQNPEFCIEKCHSAGELILPTLESTKCKVLILGDLTLAGIYEYILSPNCGTHSYNTISNLKKSITNLTMRYKGIECTILYIGTEFISLANSQSIMKTIEELVSEIQNKIPSVKIFLCGLLFTSHPAENRNVKIKEINKELLSFCQKKNFKYLETKDCFKNVTAIAESVVMKKKYHKEDGVELNEDGKKRLGEFLSNTVNKCLDKSGEARS